MVDNSWINTDRNQSKSGQSRMTRTKVYLTVAVLVAGCVLTIAFNGLGSNATQYRSEGIVVDFGDYYTIWTDVDFKITDDPVEMLSDVKTEHSTQNFDFTIDDGVLTDIQYDGKDYPNNDSKKWGLWYVSNDEFDATQSDTYSIKASEYTVVIWAYTDPDGGKPMPAVDATATSIYGYAEPMRVVSLSPVCTETIYSVKGVQKIVGTDAYSNYPASIDEGHKKGSIAIVGSYTDPSYEAIMNTTPEMVFCDASTYNDIQMAAMLRASNVNSVVLYNGEDINTIVKNIFITGTSMGYGLGAQAYIQKIFDSILAIQEKIAGSSGTKAMIALSNDPAPWVAGQYTYVDDIIKNLGSTNAFGNVAGWTNITPESISQQNPECIIIIDSYKYTQSEYDQMINILSHEWKSTDAYKNGNIYLFADGLGELGSRAGPRFIQLMELMGMALSQDAYSDNPLPKSVGDDYTDYLDITKSMG